jgi:hypothetical protein
LRHPEDQDLGTPFDFERFPLFLRQMMTAVKQKGNYQRTLDVGVPRIVSLKTATDTTAASWVRLPEISRPSVLQLLLNGLPTAHSIYVTNSAPDDATETTGNFLSNAGGTAYLLQTGIFWVYIPNVTGDPATFSALIFDVSSELPAQVSALQAAANSGVTTVVTLNRSTFKTDNLTVTNSGTPVNYATSRAVPNGYALAVTALATNTNKIYLGASSADALKTAGHAVELNPGQSARLFVTNWNLIWIDADTNGEGIALGSET